MPRQARAAADQEPRLEPTMPLRCRIRCTTARWSDLGATRCATSHTVSAAPTRVTTVSAGIAGYACGPVQSRPPTTANITVADATRAATRPDRNATGDGLSTSATAGTTSGARHATRRCRTAVAAGAGAGRAGWGRPRAGGRLRLTSLGTTFPLDVAGRLLNCADAVMETPHSGNHRTRPSRTAERWCLDGA